MTATVTGQRTVDPMVLVRTATSYLARVACMYADPDRDGHDHDDCLHDDLSFSSAEMVLNLVGSVTFGDDDAALEAVLEFRGALTPAG